MSAIVDEEELMRTELVVSKKCIGYADRSDRARSKSFSDGPWLQGNQRPYNSNPPLPATGT